MLRFVDLQQEHGLIEKTKDLSARLLAQHPDLVVKHLNRWLGHKIDYIKA
jgi:ATP-dependent DNA helicase RecG